MDGLTLPLEIVSGLAALLVLLAVLFTLRRVLLSRGHGTFDCSVRVGDGRHGWSVGVARYGSDRIDWFRVFSLSLRPSRSYERRKLTLVDTRTPSGTETLAVLPGVQIVGCRYGDADVDLAMTGEAYTGLSSWLEASPPGQISRVT